MEDVTIRIGGMSCQGCVNSITRVLQAVPGVASVAVSLSDAAATVRFDPGQVDLTALKTAIEDAGYETES